MKLKVYTSLGGIYKLSIALDLLTLPCSRLLFGLHANLDMDNMSMGGRDSMNHCMLQCVAPFLCTTHFHLTCLLLTEGNFLWQVSPANMIVNLCRKRNGRVIIIDPDKNVASHASVMLCGNAGDMLPQLSETCLALRNVSS